MDERLDWKARFGASGRLATTMLCFESGGDSCLSIRPICAA